MKRIIALLFGVLVVSIVHADNPVLPPVGRPQIPINPVPEGTKPKPLSLYADVEGYYSDNAVTVVFNTDLGDADIVVTNTTTGESWYDSVNGAGATSIALSCDEGYYEIYIYTDYGEYSGTFII